MKDIEVSTSTDVKVGMKVPAKLVLDAIKPLLIEKVNAPKGTKIDLKVSIQVPGGGDWSCANLVLDDDVKHFDAIATYRIDEER